MLEPGRTQPAVARLIRDGVLDAELAALVWLTVEAGIPVVVAGDPPGGRDTVRDALLDCLPHQVRRIRLAGDREDFDWLPEAVELGWRREGIDPARPVPGRGTGPTVMLADLVNRPPGGTWGARARVAIRALAMGYGLVGTVEGDRLEDVLATLAAPPVSAIDDELTRLGVVLIVSDEPAAASVSGCRVVAAHYLRPVQRDPHGHVQRMAPAVLATWNAGDGRFEHFAWGVVDELAGRTGRRPVEFEGEQARRAAYLAHLAGSTPA